MSRTLATSPRADGYRMPGEFEPHDETWMIWPELTDNWRLGGKPAQAEVAAVAEAISVSEPVTMVASRRQWTHSPASSRPRSASSRCPPTIPGSATPVRRS